MKVTQLAASTIAITFAQGTLGIITEITNSVSGKAKCLDVQGGVLANGTPVQIYDCNSSNAQDWVFSRPGPSPIKIWNSTYCLDAGSTPENGVEMKMWQCFDNLPAQTWYYTDDNRIALYNQGLCLDLTNGDSTNGNRIQTWKCTDADRNQEWVQVNLR